MGLLDFQLGQLGQPGYDLVSLLQDARRDVSPETEAGDDRALCHHKGVDDSEAFAAHYAALGAQRALRILGVFARLCLVAGKPGYLALIPGSGPSCRRNLAHPALADLRAALRQGLARPDPRPPCRGSAAQCPPTPSR